MGKVAKSLIVLAAALFACTGPPKHPECETEYANTISHCAPRPRRIETPEDCNRAGGVAILENGRYKGCASHAQIEEILRGRP